MRARWHLGLFVFLLSAAAACGGSGDSSLSVGDAGEDGGDLGLPASDGSLPDGGGKDDDDGKDDDGKDDDGKDDDGKDDDDDGKDDDDDGKDDDDDDACDDGAPPDVCGVCDGDGTSCDHPLRGRYAARTAAYQRVAGDLSGSLLDVVTKGVVYSLVEIDRAGVLTEQLCFMETVSEEGIYSWTTSESAQAMPPSRATLTEDAEGRWVRDAEEGEIHVGWDPSLQPEDCEAGSVHEDGCTCYADDTLPSAADDCRVIDQEDDGHPGLTMHLALDRAPGVDADGMLQLFLANRQAVEWVLPATASSQMQGEALGGIAQSEVGRGAPEGSEEVLEAFGAVLNASCPDDYNHVELVEGDFDCEDLYAGREEDVDTFGLFDVTLDAAPPALEECLDPSCPDGSYDACGVCTIDGATGDADGDGVCDDDDVCPEADDGADEDADGTPDCVDGCPTDPDKSAPGACGCGAADTDTDTDGTADCSDDCPEDGDKTAPGTCGCGTADADADADGTLDCNDECPADASKTAPGSCGCGVADADADADGTLDCNDGCPSDAQKSAPGVCGCGVADTDSDGDGTADCLDDCDGSVDSDADGTPDCTDTCPNDGDKTSPGACGCGTPDTDSDGDGTPDCNDDCDGSVDTDADGTPDCNDACPNDGDKTSEGACGCGVADTDTDGDGVANCVDNCVDTANPNQADADGDGQGDACTDVNPMIGTYAVRTVIRSTAGNALAQSDNTAAAYSLVRVYESGAQLRLADTSCLVVGDIEASGIAAAVAGTTWQTPSSALGAPDVVAPLTEVGGGVWRREPVAAAAGYDPAACTSACCTSEEPDRSVQIPQESLAQPSAACSGVLRNADGNGEAIPGYPGGMPGFTLKVRTGTGERNLFGDDGGSLSSWQQIEAQQGEYELMAASHTRNHWTMREANDRHHSGTAGDDGSVGNTLGCRYWDDSAWDWGGGEGLISTCGNFAGDATLCPEANNPVLWVPLDEFVGNDTVSFDLDPGDSLSGGDRTAACRYIIDHRRRFVDQYGATDGQGCL